jgi:hypothetical protein
MRSTSPAPQGDAQGHACASICPCTAAQRLQRIQEPLGRNVSRPRLPRPTTVDFSQRIDIKHRMHDAQDITDFMSWPANAMHGLRKRPPPSRPACGRRALPATKRAARTVPKPQPSGETKQHGRKGPARPSEEMQSNPRKPSSASCRSSRSASEGRQRGVAPLPAQSEHQERMLGHERAGAMTIPHPSGTSSPNARQGHCRATRRDRD